MKTFGIDKMVKLSPKRGFLKNGSGNVGWLGDQRNSKKMGAVVSDGRALKIILIYECVSQIMMIFLNLISIFRKIMKNQTKVEKVKLLLPASGFYSKTSSFRHSHFFLRIIGFWLALQFCFLDDGKTFYIRENSLKLSFPCQNIKNYDGSKE